MNVPFVTGSEELDAKFVKEAHRRGLCQPEGPPHAWAACGPPSTTPCRMEGVEKLVEFMKEFELKNKPDE